MNNENREKVIIQTSIKGIIVNLILVAFKAFIGLMVNSIAIILDAVNNLSDALSQVITIIGTRLSQKKPDKEHPYGYGRIEYLSSAIVACIVLMAGFASLKESAVKVLHPEVPEYTVPAIVIVGVAVLVKFFFGRYVKAVGEKIDSQALIATGTDSFMDAVLSFSTFVAAMLNFFLGLNLEGILGVILSVFILKAGLEILKETLGSIIGDRADGELTKEIKKYVRESNDEVIGAFDVILHDYGPSRSIGSLHIEVDADMPAQEIHHLSKKIIADLEEKYGILFSVGIYATNYQDPEVQKLRERIGAILQQYDTIINFHAVNLDPKRMVIGFDVMVSYKEQDRPGMLKNLQETLGKDYPGYSFAINLDSDFSD